MDNTIPTPTRQQLLDDIADLRADFQHARRIGNKAAMALIMTDVLALEAELLSSNNIVRYELSL